MCALTDSALRGEDVRIRGNTWINHQMWNRLLMTNKNSPDTWRITPYWSRPSLLHVNSPIVSVVLHLYCRLLKRGVYLHYGALRPPELPIIKYFTSQHPKVSLSWPCGGCIAIVILQLCNILSQVLKFMLNCVFLEHVSS